MELIGLMISGLIVGAGIGFCAACTLARNGMIEGVYTEDTVDGLSSDLDSAVEVAYNRGAHDWVKMNYPSNYDRMSKRGK